MYQLFFFHARNAHWIIIYYVYALWIFLFRSRREPVNTGRDAVGRPMIKRIYRFFSFLYLQATHLLNFRFSFLLQSFQHHVSPRLWRSGQECQGRVRKRLPLRTPQARRQDQDRLRGRVQDWGIFQHRLRKGGRSPGDQVQVSMQSRFWLHEGGKRYGLWGQPYFFRVIQGLSRFTSFLLMSIIVLDRPHQSSRYWQETRNRNFTAVIQPNLPRSPDSYTSSELTINDSANYLNNRRLEVIQLFTVQSCHRRKMGITKRKGKCTLRKRNE